MAYSTGSTIQSTDLGSMTLTGGNGVLYPLSQYWGPGSGAVGLGQDTSAIDPSILAIQQGHPVTAAQWTGLFQKLNNALTFQGQPTVSVTPPTTGGQIAAVSSLASKINSLHVGSGTTALALRPAAYVTTFYNTFGNGSTSDLVFQQTISFADSNSARYFFNGGGQIKLWLGLLGSSSSYSPAETRWDTFLQNCGNIIFGYNTTSKSGGNGYTGDVVILASTPGQGGYWSGNVSNVIQFKQTNGTNSYPQDYLQIETALSGTSGSLGGLPAIVFRITLHNQSGDAVTPGIALYTETMSPDTTYIANTWGNQTISNVTNLYVSGTVPGAPTGVSAAAGNAQISVSFTPPSNPGSSPIIGYTVTTSQGQTATGSSSPITVTGLSNGVSYTAIVAATNSVGTGPNSAPSNAVVPFAGFVPGPPTGVTAAAGSSLASVSFVPPTNTGTTSITSYTVTASTGQSASGPSSPIVVTGLTNGTPVTFTVYATNSIGNSLLSAASSSVTPIAITSPVEYNVPGTYNWVVPAGLTQLWAMVVGAGGGGGGGSGATSGNFNYQEQASGGGGSSGSYRSIDLMSITNPVQAGDILTVVVGSGGLGGTHGNVMTSGTNGSNGAVSSISKGSTVLMSLTGGLGGSGGFGGTYSSSNALPAGGAASGTGSNSGGYGAALYTGPGGSALLQSAIVGSGTNAGSTGTSVIYALPGGGGGGSPLGWGGNGGSNTPNTIAGSGQPGVNGGGGGGGASDSAATGGNGGIGGSGVVRFSWPTAVLPTIQTASFTSPGSQSWTVPSGVTTVQIQLAGAGGGGGGGIDYNGTEYPANGGGSGNVTVTPLISVSSGQVISMNIGAAGTVGSGSSAFGWSGSLTPTISLDGLAGGTTTVTVGSSNYSATGGQGGAGAYTLLQNGYTSPAASGGYPGGLATVSIIDFVNGIYNYVAAGGGAGVGGPSTGSNNVNGGVGLNGHIGATGSNGYAAAGGGGITGDGSPPTSVGSGQARGGAGGSGGGGSGGGKGGYGSAVAGNGAVIITYI
jgi:hypothetical protein